MESSSSQDSEVFLYPSFSDPLVLCWSPYGDLAIARNGFNGLKWYATGNIGSSVNESGFVAKEPMFMG